MVLGIMVLFAGALWAPLVNRLSARFAGWLCALAPLALLAWFLRETGRLSASVDASGQPQPREWLETLFWLPDAVAFRLDGLALLFAVLITGIGALVLIYAGGYLGEHPRRGTFFASLFLFMAAMLGIVVSDDAIALFVFWELTSVASFLLIGFEDQRPEARVAARKALLITGAGGMALLVGLVLLAHAAMDLGLSSADATRISRLSEVPLREHPLYTPALLLVLLGAFTKSAQVPFHIWLPAAMAAPTPVSAYLHSATMVKAGVFLLARLSPALGGTLLWQGSLITAGVLTMLVAGYLAVRQRDLKRILAYSTVAVLGILVMLLGIGDRHAVEAAIVFLVAHALYKAALFMVAGNIDHGTGTRDVGRLGGLRRAMPLTCAAALLAALSKAGAPPMFGFLGKELLYGSRLTRDDLSALLIAAAVAVNITLVAAAFLVGVRPFFGSRRETPHAPHEMPPSMWLGPALLAAGGIFAGLVPGPFAHTLGSSAVAAITGQPARVELALWHGVNPEALLILGLSALTLGVGVLVYRAVARRTRRHAGDGVAPAGASAGPIERAFERVVDSIPPRAGQLTRLLCSGYLHRELSVILLAAVALLAVPLAAVFVDGLEIPTLPLTVKGALLALTVAGGAVCAAITTSRLGAVAALGIMGLGITLLFALYSAPDLAITTVMVETLTVLLLVLVFYHLPRFARLSDRKRLSRDLLVAGAVGALMCALTLASAAVHLPPDAAEFFASASLPEAYGRNVVNVILVDFRALDTLGEIVVVAVAGIGVLALMRLRRGRVVLPGDAGGDSGTNAEPNAETDAEAADLADPAEVAAGRTGEGAA
ncbi:hydrogen gas-evolving membrane-bound hydrogenase subunit E [Haliangium ochraceum]|uniref:NADH/Ubiquinone/plastoquinone (Complex I) n=1 Tax=Haliangium ochraceum (strain DSM 14365 / JCM 11303 / SMP-2) TaxID=502025 RepID=D0LWA1_HALO1|nr:hydrogen gas-evolving membrane-bound hydrogenase subunit E [Haliangium ochraceum]ACY16033.1 NADH/Ubiquinone/plastoquinone (complex I) [Haliangium ochraceum DSM 14365]